MNQLHLKVEKRNLDKKGCHVLLRRNSRFWSKLKLNSYDHHNYTTEMTPTKAILKLLAAGSGYELLLKELYTNHVCIDQAAITDLEIQTQAQADSPLWHHERTPCITSSIMKEVCHRKDSTKSFVLRKFAQKPVDVIATRYGR